MSMKVKHAMRRSVNDANPVGHSLRREAKLMGVLEMDPMRALRNGKLALGLASINSPVVYFVYHILDKRSPPP